MNLNLGDKLGLLEDLKKAAKSPIANHGRLLSDYKFDFNTIHIFIEGHDDKSFYSNFVESYLDDDVVVYYYNCRSKKNVYENYSKIDWSIYSKNRILFFTDKDHSEFLNESYTIDTNIFVTLFYSIENYLVSLKLLEKILIELIFIESEERIQKIKDHFNKEYNYFVSRMNVISAWIIFQRRKKNKPNVNNINIPDLFFCSDELSFKRKSKVSSGGILNYLDKVTSVVTPKGSWREIKVICSEILNHNNFKYHLRGKFDLWFFIKFVEKTPQILNRIKEKEEPKYKLSVNLTCSNAISLLSSRLKIPEDLRQFLENNLN